MTDGCAFRLHDEKHVSAEVERVVWSPKMDLLAVANAQGEVVLHRLSWQKVWTLAPPSEEVKVTAVAWRPDGKVLAVGYSSCKVVICDVENSTPLHDLDLDFPSTSMTWVSEVKPEVKSDTASQEKEAEYYYDQSSVFLPRLPHFPKSYTTLAKGQGEDNVEDAKRLKGQTDLNILVAGTQGGQLQMFAYGVFPVGILSLDHHGTGKTGIVVSGHISSDLKLLTLLVDGEAQEDGHSEVFTVSFDTTLIASRNKELQILALKFGQVLTLMTYVDSTIQQMCEAWEDILLEMDCKLLKFAAEKRKTSGGCVSNDFLRLLMMGKPSDELQAFLLHDLTDKGLKKLGHSIETSYTNIQKLILKHLQSVGQAIVYQLADIRAMALWYDKFGVLGLSTASIQAAISIAGTFMLKATELQQVIDRSMKNFKAFFRWLYVVIKGLSDEPVPQDLSKMTQQDLSFVAQFFKENFTEETNTDSSGFKLEKVGQYLVDRDLVDPPDHSANPWVNFVQQNPTLKETGLLYETQPKKSLLQVHKMLQTSISEALNKCSVVIGQSLQSVFTVPLFPIRANEEYPLRVSQFSKTVEDKTYLYSAFTTDPLPCKVCHIIRQSTTDHTSIGMVTLRFAEGSQEDDQTSEASRHKTHGILDVAFYDGDTLSVLLEEGEGDKLPILVQLPTKAAEERMVSLTTSLLESTSQPLISRQYAADLHVDLQNHEGLMMRRLENMRASAFAVSGTRKVACVVFSSRRRVRLFIMDAEDEEDEDDEEEDDGDQKTNVETDVSQLTDNTQMTDDDEDKENSRESGGGGSMDM